MRFYERVLFSFLTSSTISRTFKIYSLSFTNNIKNLAIIYEVINGFCLYIDSKNFFFTKVQKSIFEPVRNLFFKHNINNFYLKLTVKIF